MKNYAYIGLLDGNGNEIVADGYRRQPVRFRSTSRIRERNAHNVAIDVPVVAAGFAMFDAETDGHMLYRWEAPRPLDIGDAIVFPRGALSVLIDRGER